MAACPQESRSAGVWAKTPALKTSPSEGHWPPQVRPRGLICIDDWTVRVGTETISGTAWKQASLDTLLPGSAGEPNFRRVERVFIYLHVGVNVGGASLRREVVQRTSWKWPRAAASRQLKLTAARKWPPTSELNLRVRVTHVPSVCGSTVLKGYPFVFWKSQRNTYLAIWIRAVCFYGRVVVIFKLSWQIYLDQLN